ncbi:hypothetical protein EU546_08545, partial [Candidatus Thorarchaeota archaeon]
MTEAFYNQNSNTIGDITSSVSQRSYVENAQDVVVANIHDFAEPDWRNERKAFLGADEDSLSIFSDALSLVDGSFSWDDNSCLVEESVYTRMNLQIGSTYDLHLQFVDSNWDEVFVNLSFTVAGVFESSVYIQQTYYSGTESTYLHLITTKQAVRSAFAILGPDHYNGIYDKIWVEFDRNEIAGANAVTIAEELRDLKSEIEQTHLPLVHVSLSDFGLLQAVYQYSSWFNSIQSITLSFSVPAIIMGVMLVRYNGRLV